MKLTEIAIEGYKGTRDTRLHDLGTGLNVVTGSNSFTRQCLASFVQDLLFGPNQHLKPTSVWPQGYVHIESGGQSYRMRRPERGESSTPGFSDLASGNTTFRKPAWFSQFDRSATAMFYQVSLDDSGWNWNRFVEQIVTRFEPGYHEFNGNAPFADDPESYENWKRTARARLQRFEVLRSGIQTLRNEKSILENNRHSQSDELRNRLVVLDREIKELESRIRNRSSELERCRESVRNLDQVIADLTRTIETESTKVQHIPVARPSHEHLVLFYERLDEIDNQIRRWRMVQSDIQDQRMKLRDEMVERARSGIESHDHPYHESREIILTLESRIRKLAGIVIENPQLVEPESGLPEAEGICKEMLDDVQALCEELENQYKHVRHKATVAELKQMRRCYHAMDENVKRLLVRRESIIDEIRRLDPAGAEAIVRGDQQFISCAENEGFFVARQRLVPEHPVPERITDTEYRTVYPDLAHERQQLAENQRRRSELIQSQPAAEDDIRHWKSELQQRIAERNRMASQLNDEPSNRLAEINRQLQSLDAELISIQLQIESDRPWLDRNPSLLLKSASRSLTALTEGKWTNIHIDRHHQVFVSSHNESLTSISRTSPTDQSCVRLALALAAVDNLALKGIRMPVVIDDFAAPHLIPALTSTLEGFSENGHQVILLTAHRSRVADGSGFKSTLYELPDTHITSPEWHTDWSQMPRTTYPTLEPLPESSAWNRESWNHDFGSAYRSDSSNITSISASGILPTPVVVTPRTSCTRATLLQDIDLVESIYLTPMESLGIHTVGQLLDMDLSGQQSDLIRRGFNLDQIDRWQAQAWLQICLPELSSADARVLAGSGIDQPECFLNLQEDQILLRIRQYLESTAGRRSNATLAQFAPERLRAFAHRLSRDNGWRTYKRTHRRSDNQEPEKQNYEQGKRTATSARASSRPSIPTGDRNQTESTKSTPSGYRYYLNPGDEIEAAPSIGARTAERFQAAGVETVQQFLDADCGELAAQLDNRRLSKKVLATWQQQSRLMCSVPNLRGHDVQILVKCGFDDASQIAAMDPQDLLEQITPFIESKEGARMLRNSSRPDLEEVEQWVDAAGHHRLTNAA